MFDFYCKSSPRKSQSKRQKQKYIGNVLLLEAKNMNK